MNPSTIDPLTLPSLPLTDKARLPNCPAIYFVLDGEAVLYVGRASNLQQRWMAHHRWHQLNTIGKNVRIAWLESSDPTLLVDTETALIEWFQPLLNGASSPKSPTQPVKVAVYIEPELKAQAEKLAKKQRRSLSSLVCVLLDQAIKEQEDAS